VSEAEKQFIEDKIKGLWKNKKYCTTYK
jgi:hypothetical protein